MSLPLRVIGARQHNLKDVDCEIPLDSLVVVTGPSGCGKSSLAFDTLYAEAQRRYLDSLPLTVQRTLVLPPRPRVRAIEGLRPAIGIRQDAQAPSPRSSVGSLTEISHALRLLLCRVGHVICPESRSRLVAHSAEGVVNELLEEAPGQRLQLLAPQETTDADKRAADLQAQGFVRFRVDGRLTRAEELPSLARVATWEVVVDRIVIKDGVRARLSDSVELALKLGQGAIQVDYLGEKAERRFYRQLRTSQKGLPIPQFSSQHLSPNSPHGACTNCQGLGTQRRLTSEGLVPDPTKTLREGAVLGMGAPGSLAWMLELERTVKELKLDPDVPWQELAPKVRDQLLGGLDVPLPKGKKPRATNLIGRLEALRSGVAKSPSKPVEGGMQPADVEELCTLTPCPSCGGSRLRPEARYLQLGGRSIVDWERMPIAELEPNFEGLVWTEKERSAAEPLLAHLLPRVRTLMELKLGYLTLARATTSLSGGEHQRLRLASRLGAALSGVLYILDEPSAGLHSQDSQELWKLMVAIKERGNSLILVEHQRAALSAADYLLELGPGAGVEGGRIVAAGTPAEVQAQQSPTGIYLAATGQLQKEPLPTPSAWIGLNRATLHNLKNPNVKLPYGRLTALTGVSGAGKSTLLNDVLIPLASGANSSQELGDANGLERFERIISVGQRPLGRTGRSTPATYCGLSPCLRQLYSQLPEARARGFAAKRFSFNVKGGRCEECAGEGTKKLAMDFLPPSRIPCEACNGQRFNRETLEIRYRGLNIAEALELTVREAIDFFAHHPKLLQRLQALESLGLGYLRLNQPSATLSGGEAQRVKLATELARPTGGDTLYTLDEPSTGLHFSDVEVLAQSLQDLRRAGHTVVVAEHNLELISRCDWVVELGPGAGPHGGEVLASGPPDLIRETETPTGRSLRAFLGGR